MRCRLGGLARSFCWAGRGVRYCILRERNFRVHLTAAAYVLWLAVLLELEGVGLAVLLLTISNVLVLEMLNTAVETLVDLASPERHPLAGAAKDVAAGAVLISAAVSVAVGFSLLWRPERLLDLAETVLTSPVKFLLLAASIGLSVWFIFGPRAGERREAL